MTITITILLGAIITVLPKVVSLLHNTITLVAHHQFLMILCGALLLIFMTITMSLLLLILLLLLLLLPPPPHHHDCIISWGFTQQPPQHPYSISMIV